MCDQLSYSLKTLLLLFMLAIASVGCSDSDRNFLDGNPAPTIDAVELLLGDEVSEVSLFVGEERNVTVKVYYSDGTIGVAPSSEVELTFSRPQGESIDPQAFIELLQSGDDIRIKALAPLSDLVLTAKYTRNGASYSSQPLTLNILEREIERLQLTPPEVSIANGFSQYYTVTAIYSDNTTSILDASAAPLSIAGSSKDKDVTIDGHKVTATASGKAITVQATLTADTSVTATAVINTTAATLDQIILSNAGENQPLPATLTLVKGGELATRVYGLMTDGSVLELDASNITYTTTNAHAASWDDTNIKANDAGDATLFAHYDADGDGVVDFDSQSVAVKVSGASISSLSISPDPINLLLGSSKAIKVEALMSDNTTADVSNAATLTVEGGASEIAFDSTVSNVLIGKAGVSNARIKASFGGQEAFADVNVMVVALERISISPKVVTMNVDDTQVFSATAHYASGQTAQLGAHDLSWVVSGDATATIVNGELTVSSAGDAVVTATLNSDSSKFDTANVSVLSGSVARVEVVLAQSTLAVGQSTSAVANAYYTSAPGVPVDVTANAIWDVEDKDVALVTGGYIRGEAVGDTKIKASFGGVPSSQVALSVTNKTLDSIQLVPGNITLGKDQSQYYTVAGVYSDNTTSILDASAAPLSIAGSSKDKDVTIDGHKVTATASGKAITIQATLTADTSVTSTAVINTTAATLDQIILSNAGENQPLPATLTLVKGGELATRVYGLMTDGSVLELDASNITYTTTNAHAASWDDTNIKANDAGDATLFAHYDADGDGVVDFDSQSVAVKVSGASISSLSISPDPINLLLGSSKAIKVEALMSDNTTADVSNAATLTVEGGASEIAFDSTVSNVLIGKAGVSNARIKASFGGQEAFADVNVMVVALERISISPKVVTMNVDDTQVFSATAHYASGQTAQLGAHDLSWVVSGDATATIVNGELTVSSAGDAVVTATLNSDSSKFDTANVSVLSGSVARVEVVLAQSTLAVGQSTSAVANAYYTSAPGVPVDVTANAIWDVEDKDVALVTGGYIRGEAVGDTKIKASFGGVPSSQVALSVTNKTLDSIQLVPGNITLGKDQSQYYTVAGVYSDNTTSILDASAAPLSIAGSSKDKDVTIDGHKVTATASGKAITIQATLTADTSVTSTAVINTTAATLDQIILSNAGENQPLPATLTLVKGGELATRVYGLMTDGSVLELDASNITYTTTNAHAASWDDTNIKANDAGDATLFAHYDADGDGVVDFDSQSVAVKVSGASISSLSISPDPINLLLGSSKAIKVEALMSDNTTADVSNAATLTVEGGASEIAFDSTVSNVLIGKAGVSNARIKASFGGQEAFADVNVMVVALERISISPKVVTMNVDDTQVFSATAHYASGQTAQLGAHDLSWVVSGDATATIVNGELTVSSAGDAVVTATLNSDSSKFDTANVSVLSGSVARVEVVLAQSTLAVGQSTSAVANAYYTSAPGVPVDVTANAIWDVEDKDVALVTGGYIRGEAVGDTKIKASFGGVPSSQVALSVTNKTLDSIQLVPGNITLGKDQSQYYTVAGVYSDNTTSILDASAAPLSIAGSSKDKDVTIDGHKVTATASGKAITIQATLTADTSVTSTAVINTTAATLDQIILSNAGENQPLPATLTLVKGGELATRVYGLMTDGSVLELDASNITYTTTNAHAASWDDTNIKANDAGDATLFAHYDADGDGVVDFDSQSVAVKVSGASISSLSISPDPINLLLGSSKAIKVEALMSDNTTADVSNAATLTVEGGASEIAFDSTVSNVLIGKAGVSNARIKASFGGQEAFADVNVMVVALERISISPKVVTMNVDDTQVFSATAHYASGQTAQLGAHDLSWVVSGDATATIVNGELTVSSAGDAVVTATLNSDSSKFDTANVSVLSGSVARVEVVLAQSTLAVGQSTSAVANAYYTSAPGVPVDVTANAIWDVEDKDVALVTGGYIRGEAVGDTKIKASFGGVPSSQVALSVTNKTLDSIQLVPGNITLGKDQSQYYTVAGVYSDNTTSILDASAAPLSIAGSSKDKDVTIDGHKVTATASGKAITIQATLTADTSVTATAVINTTAATLSGVILVEDGETTPLSAKIMLSGTTLKVKLIGVMSDGTLQESLSGDMYFITNDGEVVNNTQATSQTYTANKPGSTTIFGEYDVDGTGTTILTSLNKPIINVPSATVDSVEITTSDADRTFVQGLTVPLRAVAHMSDGSEIDISSAASWLSTNTDVATFTDVDFKNHVYGKAAGDVNVHVNFGGEKDIKLVKVTAASLLSISVEPKDTTIHVGHNLQYKAMGTFDNGDEVDITNQVTWISNNPSSVATIENNTGLATATGVGHAEITAHKDTLTDVATLNVMADKLVESIHIELSAGGTSAASLPEGAEAQLYAMVYYTDGTFDADAAKFVKWIVEPQNTTDLIGFVDGDGIWHALKEGEAKVYATYGGKPSNEEFAEVTAATLTGLTINPSAPSIAVGQSQQFTVWGEYSNGIPKDLTELATWELQDASGNSTSLATLESQKGLVKANGEGDVVVKATVGSESVTSTLDITALKLLDIQLNYNVPMLLALGQEVEVPVLCLYSDEQVLECETSATGFAFDSDNDTAVSWLGTTGKVKANATGIANISVSWSDGTNTVVSKLLPVGVSSAQLESVKVEPGVVEIHKGLTQLLTMTYDDTNGDTKPIAATSWRSLNASVATVSNTGVVTAEAEGTAQIEGCHSGKCDTAIVFVKERKLSSLTMITTASFSVHELTSVRVNATYEDDPAGFENVTDKVIWETDLSEVVVVGGQAYGLKAGDTDITAHFDGKEVTTTVTLVDPIDDFVVTVVSAEVLVGDTVDFTAKTVSRLGVDTDVRSSSALTAEPYTDSGLEWNSGVLTASAQGNGRFRVSFNGMTKEASVLIRYVTLGKSGLWYGSDSYLQKGESIPEAEAYCSYCTHQDFDYVWIVDMNEDGHFDISTSAGDNVYKQDTFAPSVEEYGKAVRLIASHDEVNENIIRTYEPPELIRVLEAEPDANDINYDNAIIFEVAGVYQTLNESINTTNIKRLVDYLNSSHKVLKRFWYTPMQKDVLAETNNNGFFGYMGSNGNSIDASMKSLLNVSDIEIYSNNYRGFVLVNGSGGLVDEWLTLTGNSINPTISRLSDGDLSTLKTNITNPIIDIKSNQYGYAATLNDDSVWIWGRDYMDTGFKGEGEHYTNVKDIYSLNIYGFLIKHYDNTARFIGPSAGAPSSAIQSLLDSGDFIDVCPLDDGAIVLMEDGTIVITGIQLNTNNIYSTYLNRINAYLNSSINGVAKLHCNETWWVDYPIIELEDGRFLNLSNGGPDEINDLKTLVHLNQWGFVGIKSDGKLESYVDDHPSSTIDKLNMYGPIEEVISFGNNRRVATMFVQANGTYYYGSYSGTVDILDEVKNVVKIYSSSQGALVIFKDGVSKMITPISSGLVYTHSSFNSESITSN
ncbi:hypothetical protein EXU30_07950 [Shewanella maritima]|uniref:BIG2 domain-containing protein n=1 Tax=Shewanella maritima TaxID=2520507 RepID=A0A411PGE0_9GAMM|nr:Ig-like domain-containing protein [Shewanella maritima]QBF82631.1 hypothetical protein EXU30_07950 [Shewanella maritima]